MTTPLTPQDWETLSAYLDGQLTATEKRQIQDLMALRPELKQSFEELRQTRAVLRAAPRRRAPRNFTLSPEMARKARPRFRWGWTPSFSFASAMAAVLLVLSFFFRVNLGQLASFTPMAAQAPVAMTQENTSNGGNPPIIIWNAAPGVGGGPASAPAGAGSGDGSNPAEKGIVSPPVDSQAIPEATPSGTETASSPDQPPALAAAATPAPTDEPKFAAPLAPQPTAVAGAAREGSGSGPILGIAPTEERGRMVVPTQDLYYQAEQPPVVGWQVVQIGLAGIAVIFALAAFLTWRKTHR